MKKLLVILLLIPSLSFGKDLLLMCKEKTLYDYRDNSKKTDGLNSFSLNIKNISNTESLAEIGFFSIFFGHCDGQNELGSILFYIEENEFYSDFCVNKKINDRYDSDYSYFEVSRIDGGFYSPLIKCKDKNCDETETILASVGICEEIKRKF